MFVGVHSQPSSSFGKWKDRGINCLIASEPQLAKGVPTVPQSQWRADARAHNLPYYDKPLGESVDRDDPYLLGIMQDDEADRRITMPAVQALKVEKDPVLIAKWQKQIADCAARYKAIHDYAAKIGKPVFGNFSGQHVTASLGSYRGDAQLPLLPSCDEIATDWYSKNNNPDRYANEFTATALTCLRTWDSAVSHTQKPLWAYLECSFQQLANTMNGRAPTEADMEAQLAAVLALGLKGIIWFPQRQGGGFSFDNLVEPQLSKVIEISKRVGTTWTPPITPKRTIVSVTLAWSDGTNQVIT